MNLCKRQAVAFRGLLLLGFFLFFGHAFVYAPSTTPTGPKQERQPAPDAQKMPKHVAIIMDGNGRWGKAKYGHRSLGHRHAKEAVKEVIDACLEAKISYVTLFAFSTENWGRAEQEVQHIFQVITEGMQENLQRFIDESVQLRVIGQTKGIPQPCWKQLEEAIDATKACTKLHLTVAINYGGRAEALFASESIARASLYQAIDAFQAAVQLDAKPSFDQFVAFARNYTPKVSGDMYEKHLYTVGLPPVDLMIRTGGKKRLSNFLPWQSAYAEIYFMDVLWPDFRKNHLLEALHFFQGQHRTFGIA